MKPQQALVFFAAALVITITAAIGISSEWPKTAALRTEVEYARNEVAELSRLQSENHRLREKQIAAAELAALRADHAALPRLRMELEALKARAATEGR